MSKEVIIIGAGGHGRVVADIVHNRGDRVVGFLDDASDLPPTVANIPVLGGVKEYRSYPQAEFILGIGSAEIRRKLSEELEGVSWYTAIHPSAVISQMDTQIGEGTVIMAGAIVNPGTKIGRHCILNTGSVADHDNVIRDYVHISVGARLAGTVRIGEDTWVGAGATVSNNVTICGSCMIGAGAVVVKSIGLPGTYVGVPARRIQ